MANVDETNFRETAREAVKSYRAKGAIIDALFWGHIVGLYESALQRARADGPGARAADVVVGVDPDEEGRFQAKLDEITERGAKRVAQALAEADTKPDQAVAAIARECLALPPGPKRDAIEWDALVDGLLDRVELLEHVLGIAGAVLPDDERAEELKLDENDRVLVRDAKEQIARVLKAGDIQVVVEKGAFE